MAVNLDVTSAVASRYLFSRTSWRELDLSPVGTSKDHKAVEISPCRVQKDPNALHAPSENSKRSPEKEAPG